MISFALKYPRALGERMARAPRWVPVIRAEKKGGKGPTLILAASEN